MATFPIVRARRLRGTTALRQLVQETTLGPRDFIYPLFVREGKDIRNPIRSMPGQFQWSVDRVVHEVKEVASLGIVAVILFGIPTKKDPLGSENYNPDGIVPQAIRAIKDAAPDLLFKPALPYLDVLSIVRQAHQVPIAAYQVSGEYAMLHAAAENGWTDLRRTALESLTGIKRAGADLILSYFAKDAIRWLEGIHYRQPELSLPASSWERWLAEYRKEACHESFSRSLSASGSGRDANLVDAPGWPLHGRIPHAPRKVSYSGNHQNARTGLSGNNAAHQRLRF